jgi:hypothetical protein
MGTRTISLTFQAFRRLSQARLSPDESLSSVILRACWPEATVTATQVLRLCRDRGAMFTEAELSSMEAAKAADRLAEDKWR